MTLDAMMMKVLQVLAPVFGVFLVGCAAADMDRRLMSWKGESFNELVRVWGSPTSRDGMRYVWQQVNVTSPGREVECLRIVDVNEKNIVDRLELQGDCKYFNLHLQPFAGNPKTMPPLKRSL